MSAPVTLAVRRESDPSQTDKVVGWIEEGLALARSFDGYLGGGVLRDADDEGVVHVVYRFKDRSSLKQWENSDVRLTWAHSGDSLVSYSSVQQRTGLEGWFDTPNMRTIVDPNTGIAHRYKVRTAPARWKQAIAIVIGMLPLNMLVSWLTLHMPWWQELPIPLRSLIIVSAMVPTMTYVIMPTVTHLLRKWLRRRPGAIRSDRAYRGEQNAGLLSGRHHDFGHHCRRH